MKFSPILCVCCGLATKIPQWANEWLNGMYAFGGSQGTWPKPQRAAVFWKQQIGREIQNRFFFHIHFKDPLKHFLLILIHLCLFIYHSYQYPMSLRLISILPYSFFFNSISGPASSFLHKLTSCCKSRKCAKSTTTLNCCMKTWIFCEQCYILFLFTKYNNMFQDERKQTKQKKLNHPRTGKN